MLRKSPKVEAVEQLEITEVLDAAGSKQVSTALAKLDPVQLILDNLVKEIETTVYDSTTKEGEETLRAMDRKCVTLRTTGDKVYKDCNAPLLAIQRGMRERVASVKTAIEPHETRLKAEIKIIDDAREAEKQLLLKIEQDRTDALHQKIKGIIAIPGGALRDDSAALQVKIDDLRAMVIDEASFSEFMEPAQEQRDLAISNLLSMHAAAASREAAAEANRVEAARLSEEKRVNDLAEAERKRVADEAAAAAKADADAVAERNRLAQAELARQAAELQKKMDDFAAAQEAAAKAEEPVVAERVYVVTEPMALSISKSGQKQLLESLDIEPAATNVIAIKTEVEGDLTAATRQARVLIGASMGLFAKTHHEALVLLLSLDLRQALRRELIAVESEAEEGVAA